MAQILPKRYPIDSEARKAIGFSLPVNGNAVFNPTYQTKDQIKANLINYLLTNRGERVFNPNFGADLRSLLFDNVEERTLDDLTSIIQNDISLYFPQIIIENIKFNNNPDNNSINFILTYSIKAANIQDNVNILLQ
jgi:phage baseplate assembly protein W